MSLEHRLLSDFETALAEHVAARYASDDQLHAAARYVMGNGGKRVRPLLCMLSAHAVADRAGEAIPAAIALEMVHTYSLVHDDLPCMDDDDLRRGKPTAHKVFGDALALLTGDALLTDAFDVLSSMGDLSPNTRLVLVRELATAAGGAGMVLGQTLDAHWTARPGATRRDLDEIHIRKTGYLLGASAAMGATSAGAGADVVSAFRDFGRLLGLAFQIKDDLLDELATTGKSTGKDKAAGKLTYLTQMSRAEAEAAASQCTSEALARLAATGVASPEMTRFVAGLLDRMR